MLNSNNECFISVGSQATPIATWLTVCPFIYSTHKVDLCVTYLGKPLPEVTKSFSRTFEEFLLKIKRRKYSKVLRVDSPLPFKI